MSLHEKQLLEKIEKTISDLEDSLTEEIDGKRISATSKLPFKVLSSTSTLHHRAVDLAKNSLSLFENDNYLASAILVRSLMETTSLVFLTQKKINEVVEKRNVGEVDDFLMKGIFGGRTGSTPITSFNILTAIDHTDKKHEKYREMYDELSEFSHPNWSGSAGIYSEDKFNGKVYFGKNINLPPLSLILSPFLTSTVVLLLAFDDLSKKFDSFISVAEEDIK